MRVNRSACHGFITCLPNCRSRQNINTTVLASKGGKKTDLSKQGLSSVASNVVKNNLMGISKAMEKNGWVDSQGRKGKVKL